MRHAFIIITFITLLLSHSSAFANAEFVRQSPKWLNETAALKVKETQDVMHFSPNQSRTLWLANSQWLEINKEAFNIFDIAIGRSEQALQKVTLLNDFNCQQSQCQLAATDYNRVVVFNNKKEQTSKIQLMVGENIQHRDSFRRTLKLPREVTRLQYGQKVEHYYHFNKGESVTLFFQHARKIKISVRKDLTQFDDTGKVYAYLDKKLSAIIATPVSRAAEFKQQIGIVNNEYLAVAKGEYLTLTSQTDAYIKIEQSHRGIYDSSVMEKQQEALYQPYWNNNLDNTLSKIYFDHDLSPLDTRVFVDNDPLAQKRYQNILSTVSKNSFLTPNGTENNQVINHTIKHFNSLSQLRLVDDTLYPRLTSHYGNIIELTNNSHTFDISHINNVSPTLTLFAQSHSDSQLLISTTHQTWTLSLKHNTNFLTFTLPIAINEKQITITNLNPQSQPVSYAISFRELTDLPNNELLYSQPYPLIKKSPLLKQLLTSKLTQLSEEYLASITPYNVNREALPSNDKKMSTMTFLHKLGQVEYLAKSDPINALLKLKHLVNAPTTELSIKAWKLRIQLLQKQNKGLLAKSYLEGLFKSSQNHKIKQYAASSLITQYQHLQQDNLMLGLCASAYTLLTQCPNVIIQIALKQNKNLLALWLSHDFSAQANNAVGFSQLNWRNFAPSAPLKSEYSAQYVASQLLTSSENAYSAVKIAENQPLVIEAGTAPLTISLRARTKSVQNGQYKMAWLYAKSKQQNKLLPIYADIASNTALNETKESLSIAADALLTLQPGERIVLKSNQTTFVTYTVIPEYQSEQFTYKNSAANNLVTHDFMALLYSHDVSLHDILTDALYKLSQKKLSINEYTQLLSRTEVTPISALLGTLYSRITSYGEWVSIPQYNDFAGTQLINVDAIEMASYSDQLVRSSTVKHAEQGILLRPFHELNIDLTQTRSTQIRLNFNFSAAELSQKSVANVAINTGSSNSTWSVPHNQTSQFGFNKTELKNNVLSMRWLNPYLSQTLTVSAEQYIKGHWEKLQLPNKLLFYTATKAQPVTVNLSADRFIKLEQVRKNGTQSMQRTEQRFIHPAGKVEIKTDKLTHVRLYQWQLSEFNSKISTFKQPTLKFADKIVYKAPKGEQYTQSNATLKPEELNWQAFVGYDRQGIFESAEGIATKENIDFGARFRLNYNEHWYRVDIAQSLSNQQTDVVSVDGYYKWRDHQTPWYFNAALQTTWQYANEGNKSQRSAYTYLEAGQIWQINSTHRHQWQVSPFYNYSSADLTDYLLDDKLNSDIYNFYRDDHRSGWQGEYNYRYQPWVDNYLEFGVASTSNEDWTSLDNISFSTSWNQFYHGHIFKAGLTSAYLFADDDRAIDTWQYISGLSWQKQVWLGNFSQGWLKLSWDQNWFHNSHNIGLEFSTGNISRTGFAPFADNEIIFPSLQFNHFLEQYNNDQR
ncbi:hypothetical protein J8L70_07545 [Pseudoalteromonas sp. MMG010]|uniref:hypothetical protein n=1 Tax=Pseudoalteromonas sp. MMG010 TaxID=2822685 RepID=UPI001B39ED91|nr:hypothetical protein [Pseudoalteromonas sp. MMG010]MBQ4833090.1 hypothetical protein [Pseudoalteromonas sp. MMG010]